MDRFSTHSLYEHGLYKGYSLHNISFLKSVFYEISSCINNFGIQRFSFTDELDEQACRIVLHCDLEHLVQHHTCPSDHPGDTPNIHDICLTLNILYIRMNYSPHWADLVKAPFVLSLVQPLNFLKRQCFRHCASGLWEGHI